MKYLKDFGAKDILGIAKEDRDLVVSRFGDVYLGNPLVDPTGFYLTKITNWYVDSSGRTPLYILSPVNCWIDNVWPENLTKYRTVKLGTSDLGTAGLYLQLFDGTGLYISLSPDGKNLIDSHSFGI